MKNTEMGGGGGGGGGAERFEQETRSV